MAFIYFSRGSASFHISSKILFGSSPVLHFQSQRQQSPPAASSSVQFWADEGFLVKRNGKYIPWILSYEQQEIKTKKIPVTDPALKKLGLRTVRIFY
ncbi:MAG: hypothetical protein AAB553_07415 [Patescibacteria group bacterium]